MASTSQTRKVFDLHVDVDDITKRFRDMNSALQTAVVQTLNVVGRAINKEIATDIKKNYNIKTKTLKIGKTVRLFRADARRGVPTFTISVLKKGRGLALYGPRKKKAGVSVKIKRGRKTVKGAFSVRTRQGKIFIGRKGKGRFFILRTSKTGRKYVARGSDWLYGPSLAQLYKRRRSFDMIDRVIKRDYDTELNKQFNNQFEKKRR
jgi:hypothetical protein